MGNVAIKESHAVADSETVSFVNMIERAARDPNVDVDKLERLLAIQDRMVARTAEQAFNAAMTAAQTEMRPVAADANNPQTKSRYASYMALDRALRPIYTKHGFALSFNTADGAADGYVRVTCDVSHSGGHSKSYKIDMPADGKGAKGGDVMTKTHATGSAATYGMRYLLKMIFNIVVGDDDGNSASGDAITEKQATELRDLIDEVNADLPRFLKYMRVESLDALPAAKYQQAVALLNAKRERK